MHSLLGLMLLCAAALRTVHSAPDEEFTEELYLRQTPTGHVYSHFRFTTLWQSDIRDAESRRHLNLFPRTLADILTAYSVQEFKLSLTQGMWRYEKWGYPIEGAPPGSLVTARFLPGVLDVDAAWVGLTSALAGLLCASLNKLDKTEAIEPVYSFSNAGMVGDGLSANSSFLRYGILPRENACTENLTPWKKLLPCKNRRGIATMLNSAHIQRYSSYFSLGLEVRPVCVDAECTQPGLELKQVLSAVLDPVIINKKSENMNWSLTGMFGIGLTPACPLAASSSVFVDVTDAGYDLDPPPHKILDYGEGISTKRIAVYNVKTFSDTGIRNIYAKHRKPHIYGIVRSPPVLISRHVVGTGQERGGIVTTIRNTCSTPLTAVYLDLVPWFLRLYLHTLSVEVDGQEKAPLQVVYRPGKDRERPYHLELVLRLPPRSTTTVRFETEYSVLRWTEYPPDANHGFYVGAAVLTTRLPKGQVSNLTSPARENGSLGYLFWANPAVDPVVSVFSETLLVTMPTPDFSMPYNVICLACTVAALAFGPIHNITTRRLVLVPPEEEEKSLLGKLLAPLLAALQNITGKFKKRKKADEKNDTAASEEDNEDAEKNKDKTESE